MKFNRVLTSLSLLTATHAFLWSGAARGQARIDANLAPGSVAITSHRDLLVLPDELTVDYQTFPDAPQTVVAPLTSRQKFQVFVRQTFDPGVFLIAGGAAGLEQAGNLAPNYGQGGTAYLQRLGEVNATIAIDSLFTQAVMPTLFHQDPRYFRKQTGSTLNRISYAISRVAITQTDRGQSAFNISKVTGFAASTALSNIYVPRVNRTAGQNAAAYGFTLGIDCIVNILREFRSGR